MTRFFHTVVAPRGRVFHRVYNKTLTVIEGDRTACGKIISLEWSLRREMTPMSRRRRLRCCKSCDAAR